MIQFTNLPSRRNEDWIYTSLKPLESLQFKNMDLEERQVSNAQLRAHLDLHLHADAFALVFVNGQFSEEFSSSLSHLPKGLSWKATAPMHAASSSHLNLMRAQALACSYALKIESAQSIQKPIQLHFVVTEPQGLSQAEISVHVGDLSKICLIESSSSLADKCLQNSYLQIQVGQTATLEYIRIQDDNFETFSFGETDIQLAAQSKLESLSVALGGQISRHELKVKVQGSEASAQILGLSLGSGQQHHDHQTLIDHQVGGSNTEQLYKSVLNHKARSVFTGKVMIQRQAQKAFSDQLNKNLLLSREAQADSRPQLEVLADDVKATHGSTVGQLQDEEIFYLLSRAISRREAIEMLSLGFVEDLVFRVSNLSVQKFLQRKIRQRDLQGAQS